MAKVATSQSERITTRERFQALKNIPKLLSLIWSVSPSLVLISAILRLIRAGIPLALLTVGKMIVDQVIYLIQHGSTNEVGLNIWNLIIIEFSLAIVSDVISRAISYSEGLLGDRFSNDISIRLMRHAAILDMEHFEDPKFYDKLEVARQQTNNRVTLMSQVFGQAQDSVTLVLLIGGLASFSPWLIIIALVTIIPAVIVESRFNAKQYSLSYHWAPGRRLMDYYRYVGASNETAKEVKMFGLSDFLTHKFAEQAEQYLTERRSLSLRRSIAGAALSMLASIGYYTAYISFIFSAIKGDITFGQMTFLSGSFLRVKSLIESLLFSFTGIADSALYLRDLFDFFEMKPRIISLPNARTIPNPIKNGFVFENVSFKYSGSEKYVLQNVTVSFPAGKKFALVGENGAGKTTFVKLMSRLYEPTEGRILLDGIDIREYNVDDLRSMIGVIFQDFVRYQMSARDNIAVGMIDEQQNTNRIQNAAHLSLAHNVIEKLPEQYEQMIGRRFANGAELSGGEWQKMALARAYMRSAQVIILDEPTSALDARAEHEVFQQFATLTTGKTAVFISHRFSTVRMADIIIVLENGTVAEQGSHEELLSINGKYAELFKLQAESYR